MIVDDDELPKIYYNKNKYKPKNPFNSVRNSYITRAAHCIKTTTKDNIIHIYKNAVTKENNNKKQDYRPYRERKQQLPIQ